MGITYNTVFAAILVICSICCSRNQKAERLSEEEQITNMLKKFYTEYVTAGANLNRAKSDSIEKNYLSGKLYNYLRDVNKEGLVLDHDPLLNSQMVDTRMLDSISFHKLDKDLYLVQYKYGGNNTVKLKIAKEGDQYKIGEAFFDDLAGHEYELTKEEWRKN